MSPSTKSGFRGRKRRFLAKPYKFIGFGEIQGPKPCEFTGFGEIQGPKPCEFIGFGEIQGPKPFCSEENGRPDPRGAVSRVIFPFPLCVYEILVARDPMTSRGIGAVTVTKP